MPNLAALSATVTAAALLLAAILSLGAAPRALAQDAFDLSVPKPDVDTSEAANLECGSEVLSGSGPGFTADRDEAEEVAIAAWLEKARAIYPEAEWDNARDSNLACAVQGLYSKCFADGIPCKPKAETE